MVGVSGDAAGRVERGLLYVMSALYVGAGVMHFVAPRSFERIVPPGFPNPRGLVYLSGVAEVALGLGVLVRRTRRASAWGLVALLAAVFPANVYMAVDDVAAALVPDEHRRAAQIAAWVRLPLQGVLMLWAWWYTRTRSGSGADSERSTAE
ncbi:DoxX family protein [Halocalculus aciditolerans]|uniref:Membrane protein n=1 Tax=Halocalculus aciditolerans TaxID=1383812 RepID=A0A830FM39_9EURY|nr:DoxX family membrane protein [Halocalculus aciditolerans]GGL69274.1 membrane protein [Halocalculus aciditolerans]